MLSNRIKFRHLQCFLEVARQRSVVKAADELAITQPAVSKTIRELEDALDVKLFDRSKRGNTLTKFGEVFLRYAGASVTALRQGVDSIGQARMRGESHISVGVLPTVAARVLPAAVRRFKEDGVETTISLVTGPNVFLLGQLRVGELDLVVGRLAEPQHMTGLTFTHLYSERVVFAVRAGHPLLSDPAPDLKRMGEFTVLLPTENSIIRPYVDKFLIGHGLATIPDRIETVSHAFSRVYTQETDAIWIISHGVVARELDAGTLVALDVDTSEAVGAVGLTSRTDTAPSPHVQMFMNAVQDVTKPFQDQIGGN